METIRLGEIMMQMDLLTEDQVEHILDIQINEGGTFGDLAERLYDVHPEDVELAWASQYRELTGMCDIRGVEIDEDVKEVFTRRQAWQFRLLPITSSDRELVVATTVENLARALRFVSRTVESPVRS